MHRYRKRSTEVEAFQLTDENRDNDESWPLWAQLAWLKVWNEPGALSPMIGNRGVYVNGVAGIRIANIGDWIVCDENGILFPLTADDFPQRYEAIEP